MVSHSVSRRLVLACSCFSLLQIASCTELIVAPYRDDAYLERDQYALGELYTEVNGLKLCYQERGQGEDVLIIPGLATSIDFWQLTIPALAEKYHVAAVDPPGMGKSEKPDVAYDLPWISDQIVAFMDAKNIRRAHLIGGSMGGHLAVLIALKYPERVDKIILMGSSGTWPEPSLLVRLGIATLWHDFIVIDHLRRTWPCTFKMMFARSTPVSQELFHYQMAMRANHEKFEPEGRAASRSLRSIFFNSCLDRLCEIKNPTLLIWGENDRIHLHQEATRYRAGLPDSRLVIVPGASHEVMLDEPEIFNRLALTFLEGGTSAVQDAQPER